MIKKFLEFVNEGKLNESEMATYKIGNVKVTVDYGIALTMAGDEEDDMEFTMESLLDDMYLVSGTFYLDDKKFEVNGKLKNGKKILVEQKGSWAGEFGGSTGGKTSSEKFEIDGEDVLADIKKAIDKMAGGKVKFYALWRSDMYGNVCK